jgi:hypothetical protein
MFSNKLGNNGQIIIKPAKVNPKNHNIGKSMSKKTRINQVIDLNVCAMLALTN